jgi:beta-galactosidase
MSEQVDYYGTSFYPKHSAFVDRDVPWRAALLDFTRSFGYAAGRNGFYIGELQSGFGTIALNVSPTVTAADLRTWAWSAVARGAKGVNFYAWYPMSSGYESGGFGMIHLDGTITERARAAGEVARVVDRNQALFLKAQPAKAQVAVVYNPLAHFVGGRQRAAAYGGPQGEVASIERDSLLGIHRALFPKNIDLDYVHIDHLTAENLADYVRNGGALVAEARLGWNNERGYAADRIPGMGLAEVMGCRETAIQTGEKGRTVLRWTEDAFAGIQKGGVLPARWYEETLEPLGDRGAQVIARFASGAAAAVTSSFGKGRTLMLGSYVSAAFQTTPTAEGEAFFSGLLTWAGVQPPAASVSGGDFELRTLTSGSDRLLFVLNHGSAEAEARISLPSLQPGYSAYDLIAEKPVEELRKRIPAGDVWVLRLSPGSSTKKAGTAAR